MVEQGAADLFISKATLSELRAVLGYTRVRALIPTLSDKIVQTFLQRLVYRATVVRRVKKLMELPRDPKDQIYIDLAGSARADYLVSSDMDLLSLMSDHTAVGKKFRRITRPLHVVTPPELLKILGRDSNETTRKDAEWKFGFMGPVGR